MSQPRRGRVRSPESRRAILEATWAELATNGYDKLSIDRVAAAAGVGKQTVYRWWPSKGAVVAECVLDGFAFADDAAIGDTGKLRDDIHDWLAALAEASRQQPNAMSLLRALASATAESEAVAARLYERVTASAESLLTARVVAAVDQGELSAATPVTAVVEALFGAVLYRALVRQDFSQEFVEGLTAVIFDGIAGVAVS